MKKNIHRHNKGKHRINQAIERVCQPILAEYHARMDAIRNNLLQRRNINPNDPLTP